MSGATEPEYILWLDLETTGLSPRTSGVLEIAAVITDMQLVEMARTSWIVNPDIQIGFDDGGRPRAYTSSRKPTHWIEQMPVNVLEMHVASGLVRRVTESKMSLGDAEDGLIRLIEKTCGKKAIVPLGGSGVSHFDLQVIRTQMPTLASKLTYWTIDVGNVRRFATRVMGIEFERTEVAHRAMPDVEQSIAEAKRLRSLLSPTKAIA